MTNHSDTAVIVTSFCGGKYKTEREIMTKTLCSKLKEQGLFVCLVTHSVFDTDTQNIVDFYIYDKDNCFVIDDYPLNNKNNHGVAELKSIFNAIYGLQRFNYKSIFKLAYDTNPLLDFNYIIQKSKSLINYKMVSAEWDNVPNTIGSHLFFSELQFFIDNFSLSDVIYFDDDCEYVWFNKMFRENKLNFVYRYKSYFEYLETNKFEFSHFGGNAISEGYPNSLLPQGNNIIA